MHNHISIAVTQKAQLVWSWFLFYLRAVE